MMKIESWFLFVFQNKVLLDQVNALKNPSNQPDNLGKSTDEYGKRMSRVRAMEIELNKLLDENHVRTLIVFVVSIIIVDRRNYSLKTKN
jgi:hypothetical protein